MHSIKKNKIMYACYTLTHKFFFLKKILTYNAAQTCKKTASQKTKKVRGGVLSGEDFAFFAKKTQTFYFAFF
jgi:hypothetical protein